MVCRRAVLLVAFTSFGAACSAPPDEPPPAPAAPAAASAPVAEAPPTLPPAPSPAAAARKPTPLMPRNLGFQEAGALFASRGVQPGQPLPALTLVDLDGKPFDTASLRGTKPLVLVTCSLTCNVARRQQPAVAALQQRWGARANVVLVYTIDAHPVVDDCPYTGSNWVTPGNDLDGVLVRQPASLAQRLELAGRYSKQWAGGARVLVDGMDDASWHALGEAPNLGLVVGADGVVVERCGWFDGAKIDAALARLLP